MILRDASGARLELYSARGESDECYSAHVESVVNNLMSYFGISQQEAQTLLINATIDEPIHYHDQIFWTELPLNSR